MSSDKHPMVEQEWSVHAHLSFSHGAENPVTSFEASRMPNAPYHPCYGFQRGNIIFTTRPPSPSFSETNYGSLPSAGSQRSRQPYNRRCKSTCNIVLGHAPSQQQCHHAILVTSSEVCDVCSGGGRSPTAARRAHTFTSHFCTRVPDKTSVATSLKDAASQTSHSSLCLDKPTTSSVPVAQSSESATLQKETQFYSSSSPAHVRGEPPFSKGSQSEHNKNLKIQKKPPRTVHIDVYCTGSEKSGSDISSNSEDEDDSSAQTVYESENTKVLHNRETARVPQTLTRQKRRLLSESKDSLRLYPLQSNSFSSGVTDRVTQLTTTSSDINTGTSSCALFSDESSLATSWKDTSTEFESLRQSDISLSRTESFEYADFSDKLRIKEKEKTWAAGDDDKMWQSQPTEWKRHKLQEKYRQFVRRCSSPFDQWKPDDCSDESDDSSDSELAWSFGRLDDISQKTAGNSNIKREGTVRRYSRPDLNAVKAPVKITRCDSGSFSDSGHVSLNRQRDCIGPFGMKSKSPPKVKLEPSTIAPFTLKPGVASEHLTKAEKFGTIISSVKKPGHHVGPSKNPDCFCDNCRLYFEEKWYMSRNRARSLGDMPVNKREQWKATLQNIVQNKQSENSNELLPSVDNDPSCV